MSRPPGLLDALEERLRRRLRPQLGIDLAYPRWRARIGPAAVSGPLISVVLPVHDPDPVWLAASILSVYAQTYQNWQLCVADDASCSPSVASVLVPLATNPRVRTVRLADNHGIAAATNAALALAEGAFVALLDHDDVLAPHALARVAAEIARHPEAELIFSDEDHIVDGRRCCPYFKPGWNPDLMLAQNAASHLGVYHRPRLMALGGLQAGFDGSQDHELALRFAAACGPARIRHVPDVLYHWRQSSGSFSLAQAARTHAASRRAVAAHVAPDAEVVADPLLPQFVRVVHALADPVPSVALVCGGLWPPGASELPHAPRDTCDVVVFLAPGLRASDHGWLRELVSQAMRPGVGAVGGRLDGPCGRIAQSGLVLDARWIAVTLRPGSDRGDPGYFGHFALPRTVAAVSLDCLAIRRTLLDEMGGLNASCAPFADVDLCLRLASRGLRCVWTPHARLRYTRLPPQAISARASRLMRARWAAALARDPYLNPNLCVRHGRLALRRPGPAA